MIEKVYGLDELKRTLSAVPDKLQRNVLRGMIRAASKPIATEARANAPELKEDTPFRVRGALKRSVRVMSTKTARDVVKGGVAAGSVRRLFKTINDAFYARFIERGWKTRGGKSMPGQHFLQKAAASKSAQAVEVAGSYVRARTDSGWL